MEQIAIALISFLVGFSTNLGLCARPAAEFVSEEQTITEQQNVTEAHRRTVAVPIQAGLNPPRCD